MSSLVRSAPSHAHKDSPWPPRKLSPVGILGGTGLVGRMLARALCDHPFLCCGPIVGSRYVSLSPNSHSLTRTPQPPTPTPLLVVFVFYDTGKPQAALSRLCHYIKTVQKDLHQIPCHYFCCQQYHVVKTPLPARQHIPQPSSLT